jgi:hypothetical protein
MEPLLIENSILVKWMNKTYRTNFIPYLIFAIISFFYLKVGVIATILYIGFRTEFLLACLRYGDTVNSRRLEMIEENIGFKVDYKSIHNREG